jgi:hypothetical protein
MYAHRHDTTHARAVRGATQPWTLAISSSAAWITPQPQIYQTRKDGQQDFIESTVCESEGRVFVLLLDAGLQVHSILCICFNESELADAMTLGLLYNTQSHGTQSDHS